MAIPTNLSTTPPSSPAQSDNEQPGSSTLPVASVANPSGTEGPETQDTAATNQPPSSPIRKQGILSAMQEKEDSKEQIAVVKWFYLAREKEQPQAEVIKHYKLYLKHQAEFPKCVATVLEALFSTLNEGILSISSFHSYTKYAEQWESIEKSGPEKLLKYFQSHKNLVDKAATHEAMLLIFCFSRGGKQYLSSEMYEQVFQTCQTLAGLDYKIRGSLAHQHGISHN